jgi:3-oxoacyl-[acyl-carrier protein] reductase
MRQRGGGAIVNISSLAGKRPIHGRCANNASKAAVNGLTRSMALELAPHGIRMNAIAPGYVRTARWATLNEVSAVRRLRNIPTGAPTDADELAALAMFLASDHACSLIGQIIDLDGGLGVQQVPRDVAL